MDKWISVNERMPEKMQSVLVYRDGDMAVEFIDGNGGVVLGRSRRAAPGNTLDAAADRARPTTAVHKRKT